MFARIARQNRRRRVPMIRRRHNHRIHGFVLKNAPHVLHLLRRAARLFHNRGRAVHPLLVRIANIRNGHILLGRERLLSREEVERLQGLRGTYGIAAPAPICSDEELAATDEASCQVIQAPSAPGLRLVDDGLEPVRTVSVGESKEGEIRLTYRELTTLIEEAVKALR